MNDSLSSTQRSAPSSPRRLRFLSRVAVLGCVLGSALVAGCGGGLYSPCENNIDCVGDQLRCVNLGNGEGGTCSRPCAISANRSGLPDVLDDDALFEAGASQTATAAASPCNDGAATAAVQDGNVLVEGDGAIGVCRISPEVAAAGFGEDSTMVGWCAPY